MSLPLSLKEIHIQRLRGIRPESPLHVEAFSPGINIIHGPNGVGKSTLAKAMQLLLWPSEVIEEDLDLSMELNLGEQTWNLRSRGQKIQARLDGETRRFPASGSGPMKRAYSWSLQDLLTRNDHEFASRISREMAGGVDLDALDRELGWHKEIPQPQGLLRRLKEVRNQRREHLQQQAALEREARDLLRLREDLQQARNHFQRLAQLERALALHEALTQLSQVQARLQAAPPAMGQLRPDDAEQMNSLLAKLQELSPRRRDNEQALQQLGRGESSWALFADENLRDSQDQLQHAQHEFEELRRLHQNLEVQLRGEEERDLRQLQRLHLSPEAVQLLQKRHELPAMEQLLQSLIEARHARAELEQVLQLHPDVESDPAPVEENVEDLELGRRILDLWLHFLIPPPPLSRFPFWVASLLLAALILAYSLQEDMRALLLLTLPIGLSLMQLHLQGDPARRKREAQQELYPSSLPQPAQWEKEAVAETRERLDRMLQKQYRLKIQLADQERARNARRLAEQREAVLEQAERELRALGISLPLDQFMAAPWLQDLQIWHEHQDQLCATRARLHELEQQLTQAREQAHPILAPLGLRVPDEDAATRRLLQETRQRIERELQRRDRSRGLEEQLRSQRQRQQELELALQEIQERLELPEPDASEVERRLRLLPDWEENFRSSERLKQQVSELRKLLQHDEDLLGAELQDLETQAAEARQAGAEADRLLEHLSRTDERIRLASHSRDVHSLQEEESRILEELQQVQQQMLEQRSAQLLLEWLRGELRHSEQPRVLQQANERLTRFTKGRLRLTLERQGATERFLAAAPGEDLRELSLLSAGERAQVLMAIRLAMIEDQESQMMPLFLDEILGSSDDERARAVLEALLDLARQGRQLFVFSAQEDEVQKWMQALQGTSIAWRSIDLAALRYQSIPRRIDPPAPVEAASPLRGEMESRQAWQERLRVPDWQPRQPVEELHLWHLDVGEQVLSDLLIQGIERWGQLQHYIEEGAAKQLLPESSLHSLMEKTDALTQLRRGWLVGRPAALTQQELQRSGAVSEAFTEPVFDLLERVEGDALRLLEELENKAVSGWRSTKTEQLREWLEAHQRLPQQDVLSREAIHARALQALPHSSLQPQDWQRLLNLLPLGEVLEEIPELPGFAGY